MTTQYLLYINSIYSRMMGTYRATSQIDSLLNLANTALGILGEISNVGCPYMSGTSLRSFARPTICLCENSFF